MGKLAFILLCFVLFASLWIFLKRWQVTAHRRFIHDYAFPKGLGERLLKRRPELTSDQVALVIKGLRQYFEICLNANKRLASMPSQAVDDLWHEFILYTKNYQTFCNSAFGRYLHHIPADAMSTPDAQSQGLRRTWWLACKLENINPKIPKRLPLIFAIDGLLNISDGFHYAPDCKQARTQSGETYRHCGADLGSSGNGSSGGGCGGGSGNDSSSADSGSSGDGGSSCGGGGCGGGD